MTEKQITAVPCWSSSGAATGGLGKHTCTSATQQSNSATGSLASSELPPLKSGHPQQTEQAARQNKFTFMQVGLRGPFASQRRKKLLAAFERSAGIARDVSSCLIPIGSCSKKSFQPFKHGSFQLLQDSPTHTTTQRRAPRAFFSPALQMWVEIPVQGDLFKEF